MTFRAPNAVWRNIENMPGGPLADLACGIMEARDRLAAAEQRISELEGNRQGSLDSSPAPAGGLVERVMVAMQKAPFAWEDKARAAILAVAEWIRSDYPRREGYGTAWANLLREDANRHA